MVSAKADVRLTSNFEANLAQIAEFWSACEAPQADLQLLDALDESVIAILERHPRIGRRFFARAARSLEVSQRLASLAKRYGNMEVREYLSGDYLVLYSVADESSARKQGALTIHLLAIRHHRQLSFDFEGFWQTNHSEDA